jgi:hypothetical protein
MTFSVGRSVGAVTLFTLLSLQATAESGLATPSLAVLQSMRLELDTDRPGQDYYAFDLREANPATCRAACEKDNKCRAFTFVKPGVKGRYARCFLKTTVPQRRADRCCISGVKQ